MSFGGLGSPGHLRPQALDDVRGEFKPITTCVPGIHISELLPKMARVLDQVAVIRSIVNPRDEHSSFQKPHRVSQWGKANVREDPVSAR